jgi:putative cardiolipin synthase
VKKWSLAIFAAVLLAALLYWDTALPALLWNALAVLCVLWILMGLLRLIFRKLKRKHRFWISLGVMALYLMVGMVVPNSVNLPTATAQDLNCRTGEIGSEQVRLVDNNEEALEQRLRLIGNATKSVTYVSFEFGTDESGTDILAALYHAAARGVQVRVLLDGLSAAQDAEFSSAFRALCSHPNAEVKVYNRLNMLLPWRLMYRMHDKYLIADDTCYLLGGRNTSNLFLGAYDSGRRNDDLEVLVWRRQAIGGDSQERLQAYFESLWSQPYCTEMTGFVGGGEALLSREKELHNKYPACYTAYDYAGQTTPVGKITFLSGDTQPVIRAPQLFTDLMALGEQAKTQVTVLSPYVMCDAAMYAALTDAAKGKPVRLMLNSPENGANVFGCADYLREKGNLLQTGWSLYEYDGGNSFHGKAMLLDSDLSVVGSMNMDMRSAYLDTELMLVIEGEDFQQQLAARAEALISSSRPVTSPTEYAPVDYDVPQMSWEKRVLYSVLKYTSYPSRHLL